MELLDMECARYGHKIAAITTTTDNKNKQISETLITKSLGVLQEDGIYALYIYLLSRSGKEKTSAVNASRKLFQFLRERKIFKAQDPILDKENLIVDEKKEDYKQFVNKLLTEVRESFINTPDNLFLARELLERTLIYARYHAKAFSSCTEEEKK